MKVYRFSCRLLSELVLTASAQTEGAPESLDYIPGAKFLGIVANHLYQSDTPRTLDLFHNGTVKFGDALPAVGEEYLLKAPFSWYMPKNGDWTDDLFLHHELTREEVKALTKKDIQLKQVRKGYFSRSGIKQSLSYNFSLKMGYDSENRKAESGLLFGYYALPAGSSWTFTVTDERGDYLEEIKDALVGQHRIGRSRSAEYGLVDIQFEKEDTESHAVEVPAGYALLYAKSNLVFYNGSGQPSAQPTAQQLGLGPDAEIDWGLSQIRTRKYQSWNRKRFNRDADRFVIQRGSVFYLRLKEGSLPTNSPQFVGAHQAEGFGEILINPWFLHKEPLDQWRKQLQSKQVLFDPIETYPEVRSDQSTLLIAHLKAAFEARNTEERMDRAIQHFIKNHKCRFSGLSPSQWGMVRAYAKHASRPENLEKMLFEENWGSLYRGKSEVEWRKKDRREVLHRFLFKENRDQAIPICIKLASELAKANKKAV